MKAKKLIWQKWIENKKTCEKSFNFYLKKGVIKSELEREFLSKSHINKANSNIDFVNSLLKGKRFYDWAIVGCYYAIYHASLSLLSKKGYSSKNHLASLCSLIYFYYSSSKESTLNNEDIELIIKSSIEKQEVSYFVEAKDKRETASYGIQQYNKNEAEELIKKTIFFVNKSKQILEELR